jgi:hypothetical protein
MRRPTNTVFIRRLMDANVLNQLFVIDALTKLSEAVANADPETLKNGLIDEHAWIATAKRIRDALNEQYRS